MEHLLTYIIFSPLIGIILIGLVPRRFEEGVRSIALFTTIFTAALAYYLWINFKPAPGFSFQETYSWVPSLNIYYRLGIDGVSLLLIALTGLLTPLCVAVSWNEIKTRRKEFYALILACEIGLIGAFASLDLFLFYIFWEVMLIPMYFLIGMWGSGNRIYVALKFLLYTMAGSVLMLAGIIYLYIASGSSFDMTKLASVSLDSYKQIWLFLSFAVAFAIKVPMWPFHTWLPDAHTEAPTAGSVLLAGVFLKVGAYGFYRIAMPYFPDAVAMLRPYIFSLAVVGIVYGALVSMVQTDLKRLIAYSSVSHLGFVMLGLISLNPEGVSGAVLQMVNHGFSTGALFLMFGMLYSRAHSRNIADFGGVARSMPLYSALFIFIGLSSLGLPGLNNFVGELLTLMGAFKVNSAAAVISASGVIFAAIYILWAIERVFFGKVKDAIGGKIWRAEDINLREFALTAPLLILIVWFGIYPKTALSKISESTSEFLNMARRSIVEAAPEPLNIIIPEEIKPEPALIIPER
ncbi:MAG: NADH-quinone oxidoreductase subunit M [Deltaproteobacteria bacterium]|nr:NADH-quinone oxidoreductase subunit M [Deltaproteobacteria bacterium]